MRIYKYPLACVDVQNIRMPAAAELLTVQIQHGEPQLWALVEPNNSLVQRTIGIFGTGNFVPDKPGKYISTFQMREGLLVFHAFELSNNKEG